MNRFTHWLWRGHKVSSRWVESSSYSELSNLTQARVFCLNSKNEVLLIKENEHWNIPGGAIEAGETPEQALIREVKEEASIIIKDVKLLGYMEVKFPNNPNKREGEHFYQLRFIARVDKVFSPAADPCSGKIYPRKFVPVGELDDYFSAEKDVLQMIKSFVKVNGL